jgi:hypothetical protein
MKIKIFLASIVSVVFLYYFDSQVLANCWAVDGPFFQCGNVAETCSTNQFGTGSGTAVYSCGTYESDFNCTGCHFHHFVCDTPCGSPGVPGGGGGGGGGGVQCSPPINCPPGEVRGTTLLTTWEDWMQCFPPLPGNAQTVGDCSNWFTPDRECGPWYDCKTPSNPNKVCRDCTQEPPWCKSRMAM